MNKHFPSVAARLLLLSLLCVFDLRSQAPAGLANATLEQLMNIQVTSVSKKEESLSKADAAIFVITSEDIRRSGATNIPDLLRMAPGVDVSRVDANTYAIGIRGFNDRLSNKVLVLIDGRTVYTPTTSGVYWDQLDVPLEDIDRIEVIRGPGGTVWGANAVNGVINIISRKSGETAGALVRAGAGSQGSGDALVQYGGSIGRRGTYRVFENYANMGNLTASDGKSQAADGFHMFHSGFRSDFRLSSRDTATFQGDLMQNHEGQTISVVQSNSLPSAPTFNDSITVGSGNLLGRWEHVFSGGSETSLQVYFDRYHRNDEGVDEILDTFDIDFDHHLKAGSRNDIVWGWGYRFTSDSHRAGYGKTYVPLDQRNNLVSSYAQDEIAITESLSFTVGTKVEHQPYVGFDVQPGAQLVWTPATRQTVWASVSQAVRVVSREQVSLVIDPYVFPLPGGGFGVAEIRGNAGARAERLRDLEVGYRAEASRRLSIDLTAFSSYYHDLETVDSMEPFFTADPGPPHLVLPLVFGNNETAHTYGAEFFGNWKVTPRWRISPGYSAIHFSVTGSNTPYEQAANSPENQAQIRSQIDLPRNFEWDSAAYYVGRLRDAGDGAVPAYVRLDTRFGWTPKPGLELSVAGQNLLTPLHAEFHNAYEVRRTLMERSVYGKITWRF